MTFTFFRYGCKCATSLLLIAIGSSAGATEFLAYHAQLRPDIPAQSISGVTRIDFKREQQDSDLLSFPLDGLIVTDVELDGSPAPFTSEQNNLRITLPSGLAKGIQSQLTVTYHGTPKNGLIFGPDYMVSTWEGCDWMICNNAPGNKAPLDLELLLPTGMQSIASGEQLATQKLTPSLERHQWRESRSYSSYLYGFAVGNFQHASENVGATEMQYYGVADNAAELLRKFAASRGMLAFLQEKAGIPLPHRIYRQILIPGSEAQELSSYSVIGRSNLDPILENPQEDWVIVHEMAHQWWGNLITCKTWRDFWLDEGLTTFMVAAYKEHHWGAKAYEDEFTLIRKRYQYAIDQGYDKPLSYDGDYPSLRIQRAIEYYKGAMFMDALRKDLGDQIFWDGLRRYTRDNAGRSVVARDFQVAMEKAAGRNLDQLFKQWVY